jgi:hypothetical protein
MDLRDSPYVPGAGTRPHALVGREDIIESFVATLERLERGRSATAPVITGSRGSGKTVLLNELVGQAQTRGWFTAPEEVTPGSNLPRLAAFMARDVLFEMSARRRFSERVQRALGVLKAFTSVKAFGIELTVDAEAVPGKADTGDLARDLRGLFVELGTLARDHDVGVLFALDEIHALGERELDALHFALHRAAQDNLPIAFVACGLFPSWQSGAEAQAPSVQPSSYAARMYAPFYVRLKPLSNEHARRALADPAADESCTWTDEALARAIEFCEGNVWLIQMLANATWKTAAGPSITLDDVVRAEGETQEQLDEWFMPRLLRTLDAEERRLLAAMARHSERGAVPFAALLEILDGWDGEEIVRTAAQLARRDLVEIEKGAGAWVNIAHDSVSFTVPRIGLYLRQNELV